MIERERERESFRERITETRWRGRAEQKRVGFQSTRDFHGRVFVDKPLSLSLISGIGCLSLLISGVGFWKVSLRTFYRELGRHFFRRRLLSNDGLEIKTFEL